MTAAKHEDRTGLVLLIDEIQSADPHGLRILANAWQHLQAGGDDVPAAVFAAGLPNSPEVIAQVATFSERFAYRTLQPLSGDATRIALVRPASLSGVTWDRDALEAAVAIAQGFPYTVQLVGDATWAVAGHPDRGAHLTEADVNRARVAVDADLNALFRARWEKASPGEQAFIQAMASLGDGPVMRAEIARAVGASSDDLSMPRARLIDKGLIDTAGRGALTFTIPGFAEFVRVHTASAAPGPAAEQRRQIPPHDWAEIANSIDARITADPHWPALATALDTLAAAGRDVPAMIDEAIVSRALPADHPARSIDYRLANAAPELLNRHVDPAPAVPTRRPPPKQRETNAPPQAQTWWAKPLNLGLEGPLRLIWRFPFDQPAPETHPGHGHRSPLATACLAVVSTVHGA